MLVLTRKTDESIIIDGRITIKLLQLKGNRIRLGIEAPKDISIRRSEIAPLDADNDSVDLELEQALSDEILSHYVA